MRVSVRFRLALADLGLLMLEIQCEEKKVQATIRSRMSFTERALDDYLRSSPDLNALQRVTEHTHLRLTASPHYSHIEYKFNISDFILNLIKYPVCHHMSQYLTVHQKNR